MKEFFIKVNKVRTDVMRAENPYQSYDYFSSDENPELIIRRGMTQYEDLVKQFKRMEKIIPIFLLDVSIKTRFE